MKNKNKLLAKFAKDSSSLPVANTPCIVNIEASAGGLEALEYFFSPVSTPCSIAFVIIQHLDPTRKGIMPCRTLENVIDGVVITFLDISEAKKLAKESHALRPAI